MHQYRRLELSLQQHERDLGYQEGLNKFNDLILPATVLQIYLSLSGPVPLVRPSYVDLNLFLASWQATP